METEVNYLYPTTTNAQRVYLGQNRFDNCLTGTTISLEGTGCCLPFGSEIYETNFYLFEPPSDGFYFFSTCNLADFGEYIKACVRER